MNSQDEALLLEITRATSIVKREPIQELWSGYGLIERLFLSGGTHESVVVKDVQPPSKRTHPRGWSSNLSHERKLTSYHVEMSWYERWSARCTDRCRVPHCLASHHEDDNFFMILEDLNAVGFPLRKKSVGMEDIKACLRWLATFHATYLHQTPEGLWPQGGYWHLATRPDELKVLNDKRLQAGAAAIDHVLRSGHFQSFVHGDAKLANFCFGPDGDVAAVDFQYVGGGCGMVDVAYFLGSCLDERECERLETPLLEIYFNALRTCLDGIDTTPLETEWRQLYPYAWADFHRFLKGWSPGHWKINSYSERICKQVLDELEIP